MTFSEFVEGPLLWIAFLVFILGTILKVGMLISMSTKRDKIIYKHFNIKWVLLTIFRWLLPLNRDLRKNPVYTVAGYVFHFCLLMVPIFYATHVSLWEDSRFGWSWWTMPDAWADWMTLIVLAVVVFFILRRMISPDARIITTASDYLALAVAGLPFLTGYLSAHGTLGSVIDSGTIHLIHVLSGELMLILIPFTKLIHYVLFFFSRGAAGIEFGRRGYSI